MSKTYSVRSSKAASGVGAIMSLVMLGFGLILMNGGMAPGSRPTLSERFPGEWREEIKASARADRRPSAPAAFQFLWVAVCAGAFL